MNYEGLILNSAFQVVKGNDNPETALADASYPASGSFVDVTGIERYHVLVSLGAVADNLTITLQYSDAVDGTLTTMTHPVTGDTIVATLDATSDDSQYVLFTVETANHGTNPVGNNFVTTTVNGVAGSNYGDITYLLQGLEVPVTQSVVAHSVTNTG